MDHWPAMREFLAARYRPDLALCDPRFFAWFFRAAQGSADIACAWDGERLIGTLGYIADPAFWGSTHETVLGAWLVNWTVDPDFQHGVGIALMREVMQQFPVLLGIGGSDVNEQIVARLGWTVYPQLPRYLAAFDRAAVAPLALPGADDAALDDALYAHPQTVESVRQWTPADGAPRWERYPSMAYATVRSSAYLRWRYLEHPAFAYVILCAGDEAAPAVSVHRIERVKGKATLVARVMEFFHPDDRAGTSAGLALARALPGIFAAQGCAFADVVTSANAYGETLVAAGWTREDHEHPLLPARLQPVEPFPFRYNLEYGVRRGTARPALGAMYVTRGDGDADRPGTLKEND